MSTPYKIFFFALAVSFILQGIRIWQIPLIDIGLWAQQSEAVQINHQSDFFNYTANAHPGGLLVEGGIALHTTAGVPYRLAIKIFLALAESVVIGFICALCYILKKDHAWWALVLIALSINKLYLYASPPSALAAVLAVLLFLYSWYLHGQKGKADTYTLFAWSILAGVIVSTRTDIGGVLVLFLSLFLLFTDTVSLKKMSAMAVVALVTFAVTDPYLWLIPGQHLGYIVFVTFDIYKHYYAPEFLSTLNIVAISLTTFITIAIGAALFLAKKKVEPLPISLFTTMLILTSVLYMIFLSSQLQTARYFMPLVFIWETLLPVYVFALIPKATFGTSGAAQALMQKRLRYTVIGLLALYPTIIFAFALWINYAVYMMQKGVILPY